MVATDTAVILEEAKEVVEDAADILEDRVSWVVKNPRVLITSALLAGVVIGGAATFLVVRRKLETKFQAQADAAIEDVKNHYSILRKDDTTLESLASKYEDEIAQDKVEQLIEREGYTSYNDVPTVTEVPDDSSFLVEEMTVTEAIVEATTIQHRNVFESDNPDTYFDFEEELARREEKPGQPFVITKEEFDQGDEDYDQATLTYYDGDDVLADSKDAPVEDIDMVVGFENILRFGHGSGDPSIVYIRNNRLALDFELVHSDGKFAKEVLGFDDELKHSDKRSQRKFRPSDE